MKCAALFWMMIAFAALPPAAAEDYYQEELRLPMADSGPRGLEALLIRPSAPGRYPLALISHGTTSDAEKRHEWTPYVFYRQAIEFARRGFAALVVMRRGFGDSGGGYAERGGCCTLVTYLRTAKTGTDDLRAAIAAMQGRADVTTQGMIAVGISSGGFATLALTSDPPPGLAAAINFAGGLHRAALPPGLRNVDDEDALVSAFKALGRNSRTPTLWIYSENDTFFTPDLAHRLLAAFTANGGRAQLIDAPAFGNDGHLLFLYGISIWTKMVDDFLREENLGSRDLLAAPLFLRCLRHSWARRAARPLRTTSPQAPTRVLRFRQRAVLAILQERDHRRRRRRKPSPSAQDTRRIARYMPSMTSLRDQETRTARLRPDAPASRPRDRRVRRSP